MYRASVIGSINMKYIVIFICIFSLFPLESQLNVNVLALNITQPHSEYFTIDGGTVGNGGDAVICTDRGLSVYLLDLLPLETSTDNNINASVSINTNLRSSYMKYVWEFLSFFDTKSSILLSHFQQSGIFLVNKNIIDYKNDVLPEYDDQYLTTKERKVINSRGCKLIQLAFQQKVGNLVQVTINGEIFDNLSEIHKAALIMHEWFHFLRNKNFHSDKNAIKLFQSRDIRKLVRSLFTSNLQKLSFTNLLKMFEEAKIFNNKQITIMREKEASEKNRKIILPTKKEICHHLNGYYQVDRDLFFQWAFKRTQYPIDAFKRYYQNNCEDLFRNEMSLGNFFRSLYLYSTPPKECSLNYFDIRFFNLAYQIYNFKQLLDNKHKDFYLKNKINYSEWLYGYSNKIIFCSSESE